MIPFNPLRVSNRATARSTSFRAGTNELAGTVSRRSHREGSQTWFVLSPSLFMTPCGKLAESQHRRVYRHGHYWWCCGRWHALNSRFGPSCHAQVIHSRYALLTHPVACPFAASSVLIAIASLSIVMLLFRDNRCTHQAIKLSFIGGCLGPLGENDRGSGTTGYHNTSKAASRVGGNAG